MCQLVIWGGPAGDGTSELVDLGWAGFVLEVVCELEGVSESKDRTLDAFDPFEMLRWRLLVTFEMCQLVIWGSSGRWYVRAC